MEYKKFRELIDRGECQTIDYKIECNAFTRGNEKATVELVKDIIAFANNGHVTSYLIIGVSDDRRGFKTVENEKLTDDHLQVLCRDSIFPIPKVKLIHCSWSRVKDERHKDKTFVIIKVGPQARQCFRFNKNFIDYENKYCFKKNEVWIRREATSDLALPEEIKRLIEGKEPIVDSPIDNNIEYNRLAKIEYKDFIKKDLFEFVKNIGGTIQQNSIPIFKNSKVDGNILTLMVNGMKLRLIVVIRDTFNGTQLINEISRYRLPLHHGIIFIAIESITKTSLGPCQLNIKESWGRFCTKHLTSMERLIRNLPTNDEKLPKSLNQTFYIALEKVTSTQMLQNKLYKMISSFSEKEDIKMCINDIYDRINGCLIRWRESECVTATDKVWYDETDKNDYNNKKVVKNLEVDEFTDFDKYGNSVMKKDGNMCKVLDQFL